VYSDEQVAQAVALVREGATLTHAAAAVGASIMTVSRWVRKAA
jgi:transposase